MITDNTNTASTAGYTGPSSPSPLYIACATLLFSLSQTHFVSAWCAFGANSLVSARAVRMGWGASTALKCFAGGLCRLVQGYQKGNSGMGLSVQTGYWSCQCWGPPWRLGIARWPSICCVMVTLSLTVIWHLQARHWGFCQGESIPTSLHRFLQLVYRWHIPIASACCWTKSLNIDTCWADDVDYFKRDSILPPGRRDTELYEQ